MQVNAIQRTVEQFANVQLLGAVPTVVPRRAGYTLDRMREMGKKIVDMEAQGLSQRQIGERMSLSRSSINAYSCQYRKALREGLM